jgi:hypothetical protein
MLLEAGKGNKDSPDIVDSKIRARSVILYYEAASMLDPESFWFFLFQWDGGKIWGLWARPQPPIYLIFPSKTVEPLFSNSSQDFLDKT